MRTRTLAVVGIALALAAGSAGLASADTGEPDSDPAGDRPATSTQADRHLVMYYQTQFTGDDQKYVDPKPMADNGVTDIMVGAIHLNDANDDKPVTLNDTPPDDAKFDQMWTDLAQVHDGGVNVIGMVGGAAPGTFERLDSDFDTYYPLLRDVIKNHGLGGVDLDVEEEMSLAGIERVIDALKADFGDEFIITLTPVATALSGGGNMSGFGYDALYQDRGGDIDWFNAQFYCGWGDLSSTAGFDAIVEHGVVPASKVVAGTLTNPANCGSGYVDVDTLKGTIGELKGKYADFGGVFGWEYFNSLPGDTGAPWEWAAAVSDAL